MIREYPLLVINDLSEKKCDRETIMEAIRISVADPVIRSILRGCDMVKPLIVGESKIKEKTFKFLEKQQKYDLIVTIDRGGTLLFPAQELKKFGTKVMRLTKKEDGLLDMENLKKEVDGLCEKPRILLLESDMGPLGNTEQRLIFATGMVQAWKKQAAIDVVVGVATNINRKATLKYLRYVAFCVDYRPIRLSELVEKYTPTQEQGISEDITISKIMELRKQRMNGISWD